MSTFKIMLIDDSAEFRALVERLLRALRFDIVASVGSGLEALEILPTVRPEVAIVDLAMPGLSGFDTVKRIRFQQADIKIVILTLHSTPEYREAAAAIGVDAFVCKADLVPELHIALRKLRA
ncbi:MAG: response regulator transcription factor [Burkholderiaceae bacterium]|nr:response regulator transcription factor [Sulfuritalea sp.]MCF8173843.1 response regulator transcription factor [Burkholderiaceae bacterium]MCF8184538.1 response regulator transcription factor [Polynucleobacter sp.]